MECTNETNIVENRGGEKRDNLIRISDLPTVLTANAMT
jgi:hypothetical protein